IGSNNSAIDPPTKFLVARGLLYGDIYWWVNSQGGLHVRGPGRMPDFASQGTPPWYAYRDSINGIWVEGKLNDPAGGITYISDYAFAGLVHVDYVSINNCCAGIGDHAFEGLSALPYLYLPEQLESIGDYAFRGCSGMNYLEFTDALADIGAHAFEGCSSLPDLILPASLSFGGIGNFAFANCTGLTSVILQGGDSIPEGAFYYCSGLRSLTIPVSVTAVGYAAFSSCDALSDVWYDGILPQWNAIQIAGQNDPLLNADLHCAPSYGMLENGMQWSFADGVLTVSGEGPMPDFERNWDAPWYSFKEYVTGVEILEGVTSVGDNAFVAFTNITELTLPDGLTEIGYQAFRGCTALASVNLPASLATVDTGAFYGCTALADVYFRGTPLQWADMSVADYNQPLLAAALHYTLEGIPIDEAHFPDAIFRAWVSQNTIDMDGNGWLTDAEREAVKQIEVISKDIASLKGIEYFYELEYLDAESNPLTELDLSENTVLKTVSLCYNQLESVDVTGLELLSNLDVSYNQLTALNLQTNTALQSLDCSGNGLTALDVSAC
ncbi:MAG: leucine-rich repeat protein, partial [Clostridia bacterium]|nr:leucine-rich repeat protein [Clostridia bacterium]